MKNKMELAKAFTLRKSGLDIESISWMGYVLFSIKFHVFPSCGPFFSSLFSFFTSSYNFEVNRHEKVGQKREKACCTWKWEKPFRERIFLWKPKVSQCSGNPFLGWFKQQNLPHQWASCYLKLTTRQKNWGKTRLHKLRGETLFFYAPNCHEKQFSWQFGA